jgi:hypothetical protein
MYVFSLSLFCRGHLSVDLFNEAKKHNIQVVFLPKNTTHKLQPLDVGWFANLKRSFRRVIAEREAKFPAARSLDNSVVCGLVTASLNRIGREDAAHFIKNGWSMSGLFPFNPDIVLNGE